MPRSLTPHSPSPPSAFWPLFQATHHLLHPGARPPGFFPPTFSRRSGLFHDSHLVRLGKAAAWPRGARMLRAQGSRGDWGGDTLCPAPLPLGEASNFPTEPRASSSLAGLADTPSWPGRGCSAHGEDAGWHRLIVLGCGGASHHGDGRPRHLVFLPAAPENRRGASSAPKGFFPQLFWGSLGTEGGLWAQHTYIFILQQQQATTPAMTSSGSPVGRDEAGDEKPPTREQPRSKQLHF